MKHKVSTLVDWSDVLRQAHEAMEPLFNPSDVRERMTRLPMPGIPVSMMTERDKMAICFHAGVPCSLHWEGTTLTMKTDLPCAVVDRGDGGYIVAQSVPPNRSKW
jgi:hypothetical protein